MLTQHYTAQQRRALNQIWTAAGEYGFDPLFLSMDTSGSPERYMNCIVGCVRKWYGEEMPKCLFAAWEDDRRQGLLDDLAWLALENAVYEKELPHRPVLAEERKTYALNFFEQEYKLSKQEWWSKNPLDYTMQTARWRSVLGRREPMMSPSERRLRDALLCSGKLEGDALEKAILAAFAEAKIFDGKIQAKPPRVIHLRGRWANLLAEHLPNRMMRNDVLQLGQNDLAAGNGTLDLRRGKPKLRENVLADRQYIETCFGPSLYPPEQLAVAENALCTGNHFGCHLWISSGVPDPEHARTTEARHMAQEAAQQCKRNREAYSRDSHLYNNAILRLTEQIRSCIQVHSLTDQERSRSGRLDSSRVWRAAVLEDAGVFTREVTTDQPGLSVDLLLDGSASRMHCQEALAAQGYVLAESLSRCGVPVRVSSFCSIRGYTVLRILKEFGDKHGNRKIFNYFSAGWNRDGLALRLAGEQMRHAPEGRHLLLILTDASPNDSQRIPAGEGSPFGREYEGPIAVKETAEEVRALRRQGIRVGAIFMGHDASAADAKTIYGKSLVRIAGIDQLANAAGTLIRQEIQAFTE